MQSILIVDNDFDERIQIRDIIGEILRARPHSIVTFQFANTTEEAIGILETEPPVSPIALLILKYNLTVPGPDALDLIRYVHDRFEMKKILIIDESPSIYDRVIAAGERVDAIIQTPITVEKLKDIIRGIVE